MFYRWRPQIMLAVAQLLSFGRLREFLANRPYRLCSAREREIQIVNSAYPSPESYAKCGRILCGNPSTAAFALRWRKNFALIAIHRKLHTVLPRVIGCAEAHPMATIFSGVSCLKLSEYRYTRSFKTSAEVGCEWMFTGCRGFRQ